MKNIIKIYIHLHTSIDMGDSWLLYGKICHGIMEIFPEIKFQSRFRI